MLFVWCDVILIAEISIWIILRMIILLYRLIKKMLSNFPEGLDALWLLS